MNVFGVTGWKNSGKTTLMEKLVTEMCRRGLTVSTIKHAHHKVDVDHPGKDSYRHRQAGAHEVILASANRWALMHELRGGTEPPLAALLAQLEPVDLVLIEGYKRENHAKIEAALTKGPRPLLAHEDPHIAAVAAGYTIGPLSVPVLDINDIPVIADFVLRESGLAK